MKLQESLRASGLIALCIEKVKRGHGWAWRRAMLVLFGHHRVDILQNIVDSRDCCALHAMISALELGGGFEQTLKELSDAVLHDEATERLLAALREGAACLWTTRPADPVVESVFP